MVKNNLRNLENLKIAIVGLGYVGLPLAVEFAKVRDVIGYDIDKNRIRELKKGYDRTLEIENSSDLQNEKLVFTSSMEKLKSANCFIITVPTPIDSLNIPDLSLIVNASRSIASVLKNGDIVIYESTVYPGVTEDVCVPTLESVSGLRFNKDFFCGYSPERINPGDKSKSIRDIVKVTSGSTPEIAELIDDLYNQIVTAGTHKAQSIKIAEAAKVIENTQRDLNIALMNELSIIFDKMNIDTASVIEAAQTKWNFIPYYPGLVGGHCIGVDPYYLTWKSLELGYKPEIILAGRKLNDSMSDRIVERFVKALGVKQIRLENAKILILGITFKEDCPDVRNSQVFKIIKLLKNYGPVIEVHDPLADTFYVQKTYNVKMVQNPKTEYYDGVIIAVAHSSYRSLGYSGILKFLKSTNVIFDVKNILTKPITQVLKL